MDFDAKIISLNDLGLKLLDSNPPHCLFYLNQALLQSRCLTTSINKHKLLAMTYNNLGCYYNTVNNPKRALEYFEKSSKLGRLKGSDAKSIAYAHLNIAGILSQENQHEKALRHALKSIHHLKSNVELTTNNFLTLITAYEAVVTEYLALDQKQDAKICCEETLELVYKTLGKNHQKSIEISEIYKKHFNNKFLIQKPRTGSVVVQRNLTPLHTQQRLLKNRIISYVENSKHQMPQPETQKIHSRLKSSRFCFKNIDMSYLRSLENLAATKIQAWWRGAKCRKETSEIAILKSIKKAEVRAKDAISEIQHLKGLLVKKSVNLSSEFLLHINSLDMITSKKNFN